MTYLFIYLFWQLIAFFTIFLCVHTSTVALMEIRTVFGSFSSHLCQFPSRGIFCLMLLFYLIILLCILQLSHSFYLYFKYFFMMAKYIHSYRQTDRQTDNSKIETIKVLGINFWKNHSATWSETAFISCGKLSWDFRNSSN